MAIQRLNDDQQEQLLCQAEYGMGYQLARDGTCVFLNAEIAIDLHAELAPRHAHAGSLGLIAGEDVELLTGLLQEGADYQAWLGDLDHDYGDRDLEVATHGSYPSLTYPNETFWRYSAFRHDRRILPSGSVLPGTYATTQNDSALVTSGLGAVGRYALPNPMPARYVHILHPPAGEAIKCGNSTPLFGQAGGGVEILFTGGSPTRPLPPKSASSAPPIAER